MTAETATGAACFAAARPSCPALLALMLTACSGEHSSNGSATSASLANHTLPSALPARLGNAPLPSASAPPPTATVSSAPPNAGATGCTVTLPGEQRHIQDGSLDAPLRVAAGERAEVIHLGTQQRWWLQGPALARVCIGGTEDVWLADGELERAVAPGSERTGAEWVVATARFVVHGASARVRLRAEPARVDLLGGNASVFVSGRADGQLERITPAALGQRTGPAPALAALAHGCARARSSEQEAARNLAEATGAAFGRAAAASTRAHETVRRSCALAAAAQFAGLATRARR